MTDIFESKEKMPEKYQHVATAMVREDTPPGTPRMSGEEHWPAHEVKNLIPRRRGHQY